MILKNNVMRNVSKMTLKSAKSVNSVDTVVGEVSGDYPILIPDSLLILKILIRPKTGPRIPTPATMSANRSLFVTHLAADVTEANLVNLFASFGPILSVKVCRDERRLSRGYGYVNFTTSSDARRAIDGLNFAQLNGQPIQVMVAQSEPTRRVSTDANVFVKNLDKSIDSKRLHELFAPFGPIVSSKLAQEVNGSSKGFGFVQYEREESAVRAIIALNGKQLAAKTIFCSKFMSKSLRQKALDTNKPKQLAVVYVKNLSADFDGQSLQELLAPYGRIDSAKVFHKNEKTFGFVSFENAMAANAAVLALHDKCLPNGSALYVSRVHSRVVPKKSADKQKTLKKRSDGRYVFVKYL
ncbi:unnamed protein product, partial [Oppiella nova]